MWTPSDASRQLHSPRTDNLLGQPTLVHQNHVCTYFQKASLSVFFPSQLSFSAWLSHHMPDGHIAHAQKTFHFFHLLFSSPVLGNFKFPILSLSPSFLVVEGITLIFCPFLLCAHGSPMNKKLSLNPLTLSHYDLLGFETNRKLNHCIHALSLIAIIIRKYLRIVNSIPLAILLNGTSTPFFGTWFHLSQEW